MNLRLTVSRVTLSAVVALALVAPHAWEKDGVADGLLAAIGYILLLVGCAGRIWCALYIAGRKNAVLVQLGPYSLTRNPLYLFSCLAFVGAGLSFESLTLAALFGIVFFATHWPTIHAEEGRLRELFGGSFDEYVARVPRFIPRLAGYRGAELLEIRPRIFMRTMLEASLIPLVYLGAQVVERGHELGVLPNLLRIY